MEIYSKCNYVSNTRRKDIKARTGWLLHGRTVVSWRGHSVVGWGILIKKLYFSSSHSLSHSLHFWTLQHIHQQWTLQELRLLKFQFFSTGKLPAMSPWEYERTLYQQGVVSEEGEHPNILSPAATRCWCSGGEYTIINHNPRSQIRHQGKMVLLTQEKTSQVLKHNILL